MGSDIVVEVVVVGGKIESVTVTSANDTKGIFEAAVEQMPAKFVAAQNTNVDVVAGVTVTSNGIIAAVEDAISKAK